MRGWRGRIGMVIPGDFVYGTEFPPILPEGVILDVHSLGIEKLIPGEMEETFNRNLAACKHLATQECDVIVFGGTPIMTYMGWDRALELKRKIAEATGTPVVLSLEAAIDALKALSAKKIVIATPYVEARNRERKALAESLGFKVLNIKGMGLEKRVDISKQPPYASYRLAKQAFFEAPEEADAIWISCPEWFVVPNIQKLEDDTGKPVVTAPTATTWAALRIMHIKEPIKGCGKLMTLL